MGVSGAKADKNQKAKQQLTLTEVTIRVRVDGALARSELLVPMTLAQYEAAFLRASSGASSATVSALNTANKNQTSKQQLTLTEGGENGPSVGVSGPKANKNQKRKQQLTLTEGGDDGPSVGVSGAKRIKTNQSSASDPAVDYDV